MNIVTQPLIFSKIGFFFLNPLIFFLRKNKINERIHHHPPAVSDRIFLQFPSTPQCPSKSHSHYKLKMQIQQTFDNKSIHLAINSDQNYEIILK